MNEPNEDDLTVLSKEEEAVLCATLSFAHCFSDYIKEIDPALWEKGREFALDYTHVNGVSIIDNWKEKNKDK